MPDFIDLTELIINWAKSYPLEKDQKKIVSDEIHSADINWKHFRTLHDKPVYDNEKQAKPPKSHILFTSKFTNDTDHPQAYHFKTERRTKSSCIITLSKGYKLEAAVQVKLLPPNPVLQANAGFKGELAVTKTDGQTFDEELTWTIDTMVNVPPQHHTTANLVIRENDYRGRFTVRTRFEGKIHVTLRHHKDGTPVTTLTAPVKNICTADKGFFMEKKGVSYITKGTCQCRFGIEQQVVLKQVHLSKMVGMSVDLGPGGHEGEGDKPECNEAAAADNSEDAEGNDEDGDDEEDEDGD